MSFSANEEINDVLRRLGYKEKTEIQKKMLPCVRKKDVIGMAETGTGKTACFIIPSIEDLVEDPFGIHTVILTPTRELCIQTKEQADIIGHYFGIKSEMVHGGVEIRRQVPVLRAKPHIVIATPGRLSALMGTDEIEKCFRNTKKVVLDEADLLLNGKQAEAVMKILQKLSAHAKYDLSLFSATDIAPRVAVGAEDGGDVADGADEKGSGGIVGSMKENGALNGRDSGGAGDTYSDSATHFSSKRDREAGGADAQIKCPEVWELVEKRNFKIYDVRKEIIPKQIVQEHCRVHKQAKDAHLAALLTEEHSDKKVIVFMNRTNECAVLAEVFQEMGINAAALCRGMDSSERLRAFYNFRSGMVQVLLTTDVASRGIDIKDVKCVINYDLPNSYVDYIHRVGRTGRLLADGYALSFVSSTDVELFEHIQSHVPSEIREKKLVPFATPRLLNKISTHKQFILKKRALKEGQGRM